jgi:hypothetical protein
VKCRHRHNLKKGLPEKSNLAQHAYEDHRVGCDKARILEIESNSMHRKCKELGHMAGLTSPISNSNFDISPIWILLINNEVSNLTGNVRSWVST